ncbi:MAG: hypothetical protein ASARMPREDX12_003114 [Alectoria sarmentosa]|nr:MAG: hypothetical protein ASARMPREDX12_003114 [Alectoria sarmentosa]
MFTASLLIVAAIMATIKALPTSSMTDFLINSTSLDQSLNTGLGELTNQTNINHIIAENCGDRTFDVYERVAQIQMLAESALDNARLYGVNSRFGFKAMFKMNEAQAAVVAMLDHICSFRGKANLRPRPDTLSSPRVSCVTEDSVKLYDYLNLGYDPWQRCLPYTTWIRSKTPTKPGEGESLLFQSVGDATGQATIELSQQLKAEIFVTFGTEDEKWPVMTMRSIQEDHKSSHQGLL